MFLAAIKTASLHTSGPKETLRPEETPNAQPSIPPTHHFSCSMLELLGCKPLKVMSKFC